MKTIPGLGVIGGGIWAHHHMNAVRDLERDGQARLIAMAAQTQETVNRISSEYQIAGTTQFRKLLAREDIHAVSIVTPDHLHREMAIAAMEAGKHVCVEKPMDLTVEGCREMIRAAQKHNVLLFVDFHKRYDPTHQKARELVQQKKLGQIQYGHAYMEDRITVPRDWFPSWAAQTTPFWFIGIHQVDMLRWTLGSEVHSVTGHGFKGKLQSLNIDTYDSIHAQLEFESGAIFGVDISWILPDNFEALVNQGMRIVGSEGILEIDTQDRGFRGCFGGEMTQTLNVSSHHRHQDPFGSFYHSGYFIDPIKDFMRLVGYLVNGGSLSDISGQYPDGRDGLEATRVALAVHQSIEKGKPIALRR